MSDSSDTGRQRLSGPSGEADLSEALRDGGDYPAIGLMRDQQFHVLYREAVLVEQFGADVIHFAHGILEDLLAVLFHIVKMIADGIRAWFA